MTLWGIDIGGTKVAVACGGAGGELMAYEAFKTDLDKDPRTIIEQAVSLLNKIDPHRASPDTVSAIGVCCPGPFDYDSQQFLRVPNMPSWNGFNLRKALREHGFVKSLGINDANALAMAEWHQRTNTQTRSLVYFTMSTGMGAGIVIDGSVWQGASGYAGEIGRVQLANDGPAGFGHRGTAEGFLSGGGLVQAAATEIIAAVQRGEDSVLTDAYRSGSLTAKAVCEASALHDPIAQRVTRAAARKLGELVAMMTCVIQPDEFVLGTIGSAHPDLFIPVATERAKELVVPPASDRVLIRPTSLTNPSGQSAMAIARLAATGPSS